MNFLRSIKFVSILDANLAPLRIFEHGRFLKKFIPLDEIRLTKPFRPRTLSSNQGARRILEVRLGYSNRTIRFPAKEPAACATGRQVGERELAARIVGHTLN